MRADHFMDRHRKSFCRHERKTGLQNYNLLLLLIYWRCTFSFESDTTAATFAWLLESREYWIILLRKPTSKIPDKIIIIVPWMR